MKIKKNSWVRIHDVVLFSNERVANLPEDTRKVNLEMWVKGFLLEDGKVGEKVTIRTINGRIVEGTLLEANPYYKHGFGQLVPEVLQIGLQLREILWGGDGNE